MIKAAATSLTSLEGKKTSFFLKFCYDLAADSARKMILVSQAGFMFSD